MSSKVKGNDINFIFVFCINECLYSFHLFRKIIWNTAWDLDEFWFAEVWPDVLKNNEQKSKNINNEKNHEQKGKNLNN